MFNIPINIKETALQIKLYANFLKRQEFVTISAPAKTPEVFLHLKRKFNYVNSILTEQLTSSQLLSHVPAAWCISVATDIKGVRFIAQARRPN